MKLEDQHEVDESMPEYSQLFNVTWKKQINKQQTNKQTNKQTTTTTKINKHTKTSGTLNVLYIFPVFC